MRTRLVLATLLLVPRLAAATGLSVLTVDRVAAFRNDGGRVRVGRDPELTSLPAPACPAASAIALSSYPVATQRVVTTTSVELDCARWRRKAGGWVYDDPMASGGLRSIRYGRRGLLIRFTGIRPPGPVGYVQAWLTVGTSRFNARFHNFARNEAGMLVSRRPSRAAAAGERAFWAVLHRDWDTLAQKAELEATALASLTRATRRDRRDGWSRFLLAMMHLYRFAQATERFDQVSDFARGEIEAAHAAFQTALPLVWNGTAGDTRVPGFAAATTFVVGVVLGDAALQAQGLAELDAAFRLNPFFNVFDYIPVAQALPSFDPRFQGVFDKVTGYLADPDTLQCVVTQPEICNDMGYRPATRRARSRSSVTSRPRAATPTLPRCGTASRWRSPGAAVGRTHSSRRSSCASRRWPSESRSSGTPTRPTIRASSAWAPRPVSPVTHTDADVLNAPIAWGLLRV